LPPAEVVFFQDETGHVPLLEWLDGLPGRARLKCLARLQRLETLGHELRRPEADYLRDGIYELRACARRIQYRMLYFFHGTQAIVVSHGLRKEREVPPVEIDRAIGRKRQFERAPNKHSFPGRK